MRSRLLWVNAALMIVVPCGAATPCSAAREGQITRLSCTSSATLTCEELVALGYAYPYAREAGPSWVFSPRLGRANYG